MSPYANIDQLPDGVKSAYSPRCQAVFLRAFNGALDPDSVGGAATEEAAFKVAHTAAKMCEGAGKAASGETDPVEEMLAARHRQNLVDYVMYGTAGREPLKASVLDDDKFSLRIIPYEGQIPGPDGKTRDLDLEYFSPRTEVHPDYFTTRPVLWHHGRDSRMKGALLGRSENFHEEEDGWWEDVWIRHGERKAEAVKHLAARAAIYGSSGPIHPHLIRKARDGEILEWPHAETTLSTSPQNFLAIPRAAKAVLADFDEAEITVPIALRAVLIELDALRADLPATSDGADGHARGEMAAKAGRELSGANLAEMEEWAALFSELAPKASDLASRVQSLIERVRSKYARKDDTA